VIGKYPELIFVRGFVIIYFIFTVNTILTQKMHKCRSSCEKYN
jgi:hypothetical protein